MSKDSSVRYYQKNKEKLANKAHERYQNFLNKKKKKVNITKILLRIKTHAWLIIENDIKNMEK